MEAGGEESLADFTKQFEVEAVPQDQGVLHSATQTTCDDATCRCVRQPLFAEVHVCAVLAMPKVLLPGLRSASAAPRGGDRPSPIGTTAEAD